MSNVVGFLDMLSTHDPALSALAGHRLAPQGRCPGPHFGRRLLAERGAGGLELELVTRAQLFSGFQPRNPLFVCGVATKTWSTPRKRPEFLQGRTGCGSPRFEQLALCFASWYVLALGRPKTGYHQAKSLQSKLPAQGNLIRICQASGDLALASA